MEFGRNLCRGYIIKPYKGGGLVGNVKLTESNTQYGELRVVGLTWSRSGKVS